MKRALLVLLLLGVVANLSAQERRSVLIRTLPPYDGVVAAIEQAGGTVTHRFAHVPGLAADVPESALAAIEKLVGSVNVGRDEIIPVPVTRDPRGGTIEGVAEADDVHLLGAPGSDSSIPNNYVFNAAYTNVAPLHAAGFLGTGVVIAVIDSGYRPIMQHVSPARIVSPGLNLVPGATEPPAISNLNGAHGTFVSGMAAANIAFCFSTLNRFVIVAEHHGAAFAHPACAPTSRLIPMVGSAPGASIFPIKVFPAAGGGSPSSRIIQAMEAAIDLRQKYDAGLPDGVNIRVANLSLGGPTSAAARTLVDATVEAVINADIVPAIAAGNEGFPSVTIGSPGTSFAALTVGASSSHQHEQIFRALAFLPCATAPVNAVLACVQAYRSDTNLHVAEFSSRGPTHDGRIDPDVVANGAFNYSQGGGNTAGTVNFGSGTSYATPTVSGVAALLAQAEPGATARQIRNAIIMSADPSRIPTAGPNDQGAGLVNAAAARALLQAGDVPDSYDTAGFTRILKANMTHAGAKVYKGPVSLAFNGVRPAEVTDIPYDVNEQTENLFVRIHSITAELPLAEQNPFFTDDVFFRIQSSVVHNDDVRVATFITVADAEASFTFPRPETGVWRITPAGDWTNAGRVSYVVDIWTTKETFPKFTAKNKIDGGELQTYEFTVPAGTATLETRLEWQNMNGNYPINDVDVILTPPSGPVVNSCNTGRTPEWCVINNPVAGTWKAIVVGFNVFEFGTPGGREVYTLRIEADGNVISVKK